MSGREAPGIRLRAEGGSFGTYDGTARVAGVAGDQFDYAVSGSFNHTDGYPTAPGGTRDVGSENVGTSAKVNWTPASNFRLTGVLRYSYTRADRNDSGITANSPVVNGRQIQTTIDTPGSYYKNGAWYGLARAEFTLFDGLLTSALSGQFADTYRDAFSSFGYSYGDKGTRYRGSFENTLNFGDDHLKHALTLAIDLEREEFRNIDPTGYADTSKHVLNTVGFVGQYRLTIDDRFAIGGSVRHNDNDFFDDDTTWHVDRQLRLPDRHAPACSCRHRHQESRCVRTVRLFRRAVHRQSEPEAREIGGLGSRRRPERPQWRDHGRRDLFQQPPQERDLHRLSAADYTSTAFNRDTVTYQEGVELFGQARIGDFRIDTSYTYLDAPQSRNVLLNPTDPNSFASGPVLAQAVRRPKIIGSANLTYAPKSIPASATLTIRYNGKMKDVIYDANYSAMYKDMPAFTLVNLALRYDMRKNIQLYVRAENLFDEKYQEVFTFDTPGLAVYGGLRLRF